MFPNEWHCHTTDKRGSGTMQRLSQYLLPTFPPPPLALAHPGFCLLGFTYFCLLPGCLSRWGFFWGWISVPVSFSNDSPRFRGAFSSITLYSSSQTRTPSQPGSAPGPVRGNPCSDHFVPFPLLPETLVLPEPLILALGCLGDTCAAHQGRGTAPV